MRALLFDTETTGKANFKAPYNDPTAPRLVQLGAIYLDINEDNHTAKEIQRVNVIVKPDGYIVPEEAANIHGITTAHANDHGISMTAAVGMFCELLSRSDMLMAYNIEYDMRVMFGELYRKEDKQYFASSIQDLTNTNKHCIMKPMTDICKIPVRWGYKWPKLQEAYEHCFGKKFDDAHDAMADVLASLEVYLWWRKRYA